MAGPNERTERDFSRDLNNAVAATEDEIFGEALGDDPLDNDGDTSLEDMGEGLEGDEDLEDEGEDADEEADGEGEPEEGEEDEESEGAEPESAEPQARNRRGEFDPKGGLVPSSRLREATERARQAEERYTRLERELAEQRGQVTQLTHRVNAPPRQEQQQQPKKKPDMFADPEGYERYMIEEAERRADERVNRRLAEHAQQQQEERETTVNVSLNRAAQGERSFEYNAAYNTLLSFDPADPRAQQLVRAIVSASDPGAALFEWWDGSGLSERYRSHVAKQLGIDPQLLRRGAEQGDEDEQGEEQEPQYHVERVERREPRSQQRPPQSQQPRHVTRLPQNLRRQPPSLNAARGGGRQDMQNPESLDGSEGSIFEFGSRK